MMVTLGTDAHKRSRTIVAVDTAGAEIGSVSVAATTDGHLGAVQWAASTRRGSGLLRTAVRCRVGLKLICWAWVNGWFVCRPR